MNTGKPPHPLHRLDMNTSGVVLFGKSPDIVAAMHDQFREQRVRKQYLALSLGIPEQSSFTAEGGIGQHPSLKCALLCMLQIFCGIKWDGLPGGQDMSQAVPRLNCPVVCDRVARMVCEDGLPSRTDFWVLDKSEVDFTSEVSPSELVPDISSLETRSVDDC